MSTFTAKVVSVNLGVDYPKKDGSGSYEAFILKYQLANGTVRDLIKPMAGLRLKPIIRNTLSELQPGDTFTLQLEENKGGFLDIVALVKGEGGIDMVDQASRTEAAKTRTAAPTGKVIGSTYETPEERKVRQRLIVRQSSFEQARQIVTGGKPGKLEDILPYAEEIEVWVYRGLE
jgi:hypothetical protein